MKVKDLLLKLSNVDPEAEVLGIESWYGAKEIIDLNAGHVYEKGEKVSEEHWDGFSFYKIIDKNGVCECPVVFLWNK